MENKQDLEPEAEFLLKSDPEVVNAMPQNPALYSIAISLKRIADVMTIVPRLNTEGMSEADLEQMHKSFSHISFDTK